MNPFNDLVPPNMDQTCVTGVTSTVCSDPWDYYKASTIDFVFFAIGIAFAYLFVTRR